MSSLGIEAYNHFKETLNADLKQNLKPVIISLTMLAEDYQHSANLIAKSIEEYIHHIPSELKILGLYLMDSIMKNIKSTHDYKHLFERNIITLFCYVFESVDEQNRKALYKLRQTWNDLFNQNVLYKLDLTVKKIDPAWPITSNIPSSQTNNSEKIKESNTKQPMPNGHVNTSTTTTTTTNSSKPGLPTVTTTTLTATTNTITVVNKIVSSSVNNNEKIRENKEDKIIEKDHQQSMSTHANNAKQLQDRKETESQTRKSRFEPIQAVSSQNPAQAPRDPRLANRKPKEESRNPISMSSPDKLKHAQNDLNQSSNHTGVKRLSTSPNHADASDVKKPRISSSNSSNTNRPKSNDNLRNLNKSSEPSSKPANTLIKKQQNHTQQENKVPTSNINTHANTMSKQHQVDAKNSTSTTNKSVNSEHEQLNKNKASKQNDSNTNQPKQSSSQMQQKQPAAKSNANNSNSKEEMNVDENEKKRSNRNETNTGENTSNKSNPSSNTSKKIPSLLEVPIQPPKSLVQSPEKGAKSKAPSRFSKPNENTNKSVKTDHKNKQLSVNENRSVSPSSSSKPKKAKLSETTKLNDENYERDVDLRSFNRLDEFKNQISFLNSLLPKTNTRHSPTQMVTDDTHTDSNKEANNDQLEKNRNSLNELQKRLIESKENDDVNSKAASSTTTLDLMDMIKTLIKQQESILNKQKAIFESENVTNQPGNDMNMQHDDQQVIQQGQNEYVDQPIEQEEDMSDKDQQSYMNEFASQTDLPPIKAKDKNENNNDSLLLIDARSYRIQPDTRCLIRIYYHDHELFCDTRTKDVYIDSKRVLKMGDQTKDIQLNGRKVRVLYMGKKIELWIDGISFHFRADSPPKQITLASSQQVKRYHVTIDSRTMDMYFNNYKVCNINGGPYGNGQNIIMCQLSPDDDETHEISFVCPPKRIMIDGLPRKMRYDLRIPCIEMDNGELYVIRFSGAPKEIYIDNNPYLVHFDQTLRIKLNGRVHELAWGGPGFEVIIDGRPYELQFNKPPREIIIGTRSHLIYIGGDAPDVKICGKVPYELLEEAPASQPHHQTVTSQNRPAPLMSQQIQAPSDLTKSSTSDSKPPNVHELLSKLIQYNILPTTADSKTQTSTTSTTTSGEEKKPVESKIPDLTSFDSELLKQKYNSAIQSLYTGIQCATCGHRFNQTESNNKSRYSKHLDWHFRQNKREKDEINKAHSRSWYYSFSDWILYEEISEDQTLSEHQTKDLSEANLDSNTTSSTAGHSSSTSKKTKKHLAGLLSDDYDEEEDNDDDANELNNEEPSEFLNDKDPNDTTFNINNNIENILRDTSMAFNLDGVKTCPASDDVGDSCYICNDPFEIFFHQEKEEWHFKDAVRIDNRLYHPICLEDNINNQSVVKDEPV